MSHVFTAHVPTDRLGEAAQHASLDGLRPLERDHVQACQKCQSLYAGYRMADRLLAASWRQTTLPASAVAGQPKRRPVAAALRDFAGGFELRHFAPAALGILLVATIGLAFALPWMMPAAKPSTSLHSPIPTQSASPSPSATTLQPTPQPSSSPSEAAASASASQPSGGDGGATPEPKATASPTPVSAGTSGPVTPISVSDLAGWPIAWAPDGHHLLLVQVTTGWQGGSQIQIRDAAGRLTGSTIGSAAAWVDSTTIAIATASSGHGSPVGGSTVELVDVTGHQIAILPGSYASPDTTQGVDGGVLVGSGTGQLAVVVQSGPSFYGATYITWSGHSVTASRQGVPVSFSQDGSKLAVIHPVYGPGGSLGEDLAGSLEIVSVPGMHSLASFPHLRIVARSNGVQPDLATSAFSPDGSSLLVSETLVDLTQGTSTKVGAGGWLPDGTLVTASNGQVLRWHGTRSSADARFPAGGIVETSRQGDVVEYFTDGRAPVFLSANGSLSRLSIPGVASIGDLLISPDGREVALEGRAPGGTTVTVVTRVK